MSNQDCNCEQSERLKKELVEMCDIIETYGRELDSPVPCWHMRDNLRKRIRTRAAELKVRYSK